MAMRAHLVILGGAGLQDKGTIMRNAPEIEDKCAKS